MTKRIRKRRSHRTGGSTKGSRKSDSRRHRQNKGKYRPNVRRRRAGIGDARLERGLRVLRETKDINTAARAIRVSPDRFKRAAKRRGSIRRRGRQWTVARRLPRKMPIFSGGKSLAITVTSKSASLIGRYMSAVGQFLKTNNPEFLAEFKDRSVKDASGKLHQFETNPNALYRLASAGGEPFEDIYRIVI